MSQELATKELLLCSMFMEKMKLIGFGRSITIIWSHWNTALWPNEVINAFYAFLSCVHPYKEILKVLNFEITDSMGL